MDLETYTRGDFTIQAYVLEYPTVVPIDRLSKADSALLATETDLSGITMPNGQSAENYFDIYAINIEEYLDLIESYDISGTMLFERTKPVDEVITIDLKLGFSTTWVGLILYDAVGDPVPFGDATGDFTVTGKHTVNDSELPVQDAVIFADMPNVVTISNTPLRQIKVTPDTIAGATTYKVMIHQS